MRAVIVCVLILAATAPARAWDRACFVRNAAPGDGGYFREVHNPSVGAGWTYTATPPVEMTRRTFYDVPVTIVITVSTTPLITRTRRTHTTIYTDVVSALGFVPYTIAPTDLNLRFTAPYPFRAYHCAPGVTAHTFLPISR